MKNLLFFISAFFPPFLSMGSTGPSDAIDMKHYTFRIDLNDSTDVIAGSAELAFLCKKSISEFDLDLVGKSADAKGMQVNRVTWNGAPLKFSHQNDRLKISFSAPVALGRSVTVTISYSGIPKDGLIISKNKFNDRTFFADNWPDRGRNWLPVIDHPADKAAVDFIVVAPHHYEVIANGVRVEETYLSRREKLTHYKEEAEIPVKVMVIGAARFAIEQSGTVSNIPVESWVYYQNRGEGFYDYKAAARILDFFIGHIGPYSYRKLANVQSKTIFGGLENASAIFYSENSVNGKADHEDLLAHEIAHQWFGDSASEKEWAHIWLSEGFATYFCLLYLEYTYGDDKRKIEMKKDRDQVLAYYKQMQTPVVNAATTDLMSLLNPNSYQKGSWVLHMLRREIGDENFWKGIREYYRQFQNANALTSDLRQVMEAVSGKDLDTFFRQWIFEAGHPVLDGSWKYDETAQNLQVTVKQVQKGIVFSFPLEIAIYTRDGEFPVIEKLSISKASGQFSIPMSQKPVKIVLDPSVNLLFDGKLKN